MQLSVAHWRSPGPATPPPGKTAAEGPMLQEGGGDCASSSWWREALLRVIPDPQRDFHLGPNVYASCMPMKKAQQTAHPATSPPTKAAAWASGQIKAGLQYRQKTKKKNDG